MNLFRKTLKLQDERGRDGVSSVDLPWQHVDIISSNCPSHTGVRLAKVGDNMYQCPFGKEVYKANGSISNQTNKDNYYLGIVIK
jgi:hypothetical protein